MATEKKTKKASKPVTKKAADQKATTKKARVAKADKKLSALDAAAKVLAETKEPMNAKQMIEAMAAKGYWKSPGGQTPSSTLYAAIIREAQKKGKESRFTKTDRGLFALNR